MADSHQEDFNLVGASGFGCNLLGSGAIFHEPERIDFFQFVSHENISF
jgi:hypothetical protein